MSINLHKPHVWLIPEDDANRQLANGFFLHFAVSDDQVHNHGPAGGWKKVADVFQTEYLAKLRQFPGANVIMLIDFDEDNERFEYFTARIPEDVRSRVFVIGTWDEPEELKRQLKSSYEKIGQDLADDCDSNNFELWCHKHLKHNNDELERLVKEVRPILFAR